MNIKEFKREDYAQIFDWYLKRNLAPALFADLPKHGYLIDNVVCGFIVSTDADFCILEYAISNPECSKELRKEGSMMVLAQLEKKAKTLGYKRMLCFLNHAGVIDTFDKRNFNKQEDCKVYSKEIQ